MNRFPFFLFMVVLMCCYTKVWNQNTVGVISYESELSYPGYNLVFPHGQGTVWLLNECGEVVHRWDDDQDRVPGNSVYLQANGDLLVCYNRRGSNNDPIWAGGGGQYVEWRTWDNEVVWEFELNDSLRRLHHDVTPMPNGNVLMIAWENKTPQESIDNGRDPLLITEGAVWPDYILEYDPVLDSIVWEWHAWDHLIQEFDNTKANFGVVSDHPELIHINHIYASGQADWMHSNAIDYNPDLDIVMISVPHFDEVWFIDHSTTAEESKSHSGGYWGKGGDLIYRWGNPRAYHRGDTIDQKLFFSHECHWIEDFVDESNPFYGSIAVFNNRYGDNYSAANIFTPVVDTLNRIFGMNDGTWGPEDYDLTVLHPVSPQLMYSSGLGSFQILPNNNYLLMNGRNGYALEVTPDQQLAWEYIVPIKNGAFISQGELSQNNTTFRIKRYPVSYEAFYGRDLTPNGYMELNPDTSYCDQLISSSYQSALSKSFSLFPNPASDFISISEMPIANTAYTISDALGRIIKEGEMSSSSSNISIVDLIEGTYYLKIEGLLPKLFVVGK